jgi:hypothetical protein
MVFKHLCLENITLNAFICHIDKQEGLISIDPFVFVPSTRDMEMEFVQKERFTMATTT